MLGEEPELIPFLSVNDYFHAFFASLLCLFDIGACYG